MSVGWVCVCVNIGQQQQQQKTWYMHTVHMVETFKKDYSPPTMSSQTTFQMTNSAAKSGRECEKNALAWME